MAALAGLWLRAGSPVLLLAVLATAPLERVAAAPPCPDCSHIEAELESARKRQADLEQELQRLRGETEQNAAQREDIARRFSEIAETIERQGETYVSTDESGAELRTEYDLETGERVTTRRPPGGPSTEVSREPSRWLQNLLAQKAELEEIQADLEARAGELAAERQKTEADLAAAGERVAELERQLAECRKQPCPHQARQTLELVVDRAEVMEFRIPPGQDAHAITEGLPGAVLFPIPEGAGGGFQVAVPVPTDPDAAAALKESLADLQERGLIEDLQVTPCRKFLPEGPGSEGAPGTPTRTRLTVEVVKGSAHTSTGVELGQSVVVLVPPPVVQAPGDPEAEDEQDDGQPPGPSIDVTVVWLPGVDDQPPAIGIPDPNGDFVIVVPEGYHGPYTIMIAPICNCTTTTTTLDDGTTTVPVGPTEEEPPPPEESDDGTTTTEEDKPETCYCGPDITAAMTEAINRAQQRIEDLPDNEKGPYDGFEFLYNNADAFDAPVAPLRDPTVDLDSVTDPVDALLCPSGVCARMGQVPFSLAGYCLPKHMSNEILAAFVASGVGVPLTVFSAGANVKEVLNYGSLEGDAPFIAYLIGYQLQSELEDLGSLTSDQVSTLVADVLETSLFGFFQNYGEIKEEYPTLEQCEDCPYDAPAHFTKDFTTKPWRLADGTRVGEEEASSPMSEDPPDAGEMPPLKPGAAPPQDCDTGAGAGAAGEGATAPAGGTAPAAPPGGTGAPPGDAPDPSPEEPGGADPGDESLRDQVEEEIVDCCTLLKNVLADIEATPFGQSARGQGIIETVKGYLCGDITFAVTGDGRVLQNGPPLPETEDASGDGDLVQPGEARYERTLRMGVPGLGGFHSEEIYIGIDQSTRGILRALQEQDKYYFCDHNGKLSTILKQDLVHNLIHEGLHATIGGGYNVDGMAPLEEELDAFNAGNEANAAMGLPPSVDRPGRGYGAGTNPDYPVYSGE